MHDAVYDHAQKAGSVMHQSLCGLLEL